MQTKSAETLIDVHRGLKFARSPRWVGRELLFLDTYDRWIKSADLDGTVQKVRELPCLPGGFDILADGRLIVGDAHRREMYVLYAAGWEQLANLRNVAGFVLNDSVIDGRGGVYIADAGFDYLNPLVNPVPNGVIVYVRVDGKSTVVAEDLFFPNGLVVSPDNGNLIVAETLAHRLVAFDIEDDGSLKNRRVWAQFNDDINPDGICLDCNGGIWVAGTRPCALHVREGGEIVQQITTMRPVFATMLGGPERRHLFLCTSDSNDPVICRQSSSATIDIAEVDTPGIEHPFDRTAISARTCVTTRPEVRDAV